MDKSLVTVYMNLPWRAVCPDELKYVFFFLADSSLFCFRIPPAGMETHIPVLFLDLNGML